ncbi:MAG: hypothetical protein ACTSPY_13800 [Candidatus Helarchaeota archaeon]
MSTEMKKKKKKYHLRAIKTNMKFDVSGSKKGNDALETIKEGIEE